MSGAFEFARQVIDWQLEHGRHGLPWQVQDPYKVWISEVMLQQTQVATVLPYYARFLHRFPTVQALAQAPEQDVMAHWSGLGYYSRARNLHKGAKQVMAIWGGSLPNTAKDLQTLPGIGPSTAAAIAAFCHGERVAILDGNVQRVLSRFLGFAQDLSQSQAKQTLWEIANQMLPKTPSARQMPAYTQGLMDLGATVCTRKNPNCPSCPLRLGCKALAADQIDQYPFKSVRLKRPTEHWWLLLQRNRKKQVWLAPRPNHGIWAGLYAPPIWTSEDDSMPESMSDLSIKIRPDLPIKHLLTHKILWLHPLWCAAQTPVQPAQSEAGGRWMGPREWALVGLARPIQQLLSLS